MARVIDVDFNANLARFSSQIDKATADLNRFQSNADRMAKNVSTAFGALGIGLSVAAFASLGKTVIDTADSMAKLSLRTGATTKDLASLKLISEQSDTSLEAVGKAIGKLNLSFSQAQGGSKETAEALKRLGVNSSDARERFFQLADAYQKAGGDTRVLADIQKVLGKSYQELIPLLAQGGDGLRRAAQESESFADAMARLAPEAEKFNDELTKLKNNAAGFVANVLPPLVAGFNVLIEKLRGGTGNDPFDDYLTWLGEAANRQERLNDVQKKFGAGSVEYKAAANALQIALDKLKQYQNAAAAAQQSAAKPQDSNAAEIACVASGGTWSNGRCIQKTATRTDPLASLLSSTDIEKTREYNRLLDLLNQRFDGGRKNAELYQQALDQLNKRFGVNQPLIDALGSGSFKTSSKEVADFIREQQDAINDLNREMASDKQRAADAYASKLHALIADTDIEKTKAFYENIDLLNQAFFDGEIGAVQYQQAIEKLTSSKAQEQAKETKSIFEEMGIVMVSHLEDAISGGKDLSDVFKAMERDIVNLIIRLTVMEPLLNGIKGIFSSTGSSSSSSGSGFNLGNIFQTAIDWIFSANGNVFSNAPGLSAYSSSVVNKPTVFPFAKGMGLMGEAGPEAIMPLTRMNNGKLGVMAANDGGGVVVNVINNANGTQATANERTDQNGNRIIDVMIEQVEQKMAGNVAQGRGPLASALSNTYGLNRVAGSY